ncbi:MAG TPA: nucleotidyltransferase family protein [Phycisphaerae bacterium]|nr:nucleotidyltransferase family protein [Phycisphaerae bacterium]
MVLAAGQSRRMGTSKQLLAYRGSTFIETVLQAVLDSSVDGLIVVANQDVGDYLRDRLPDENCSLVVNSEADSPMIRSVQLGVETATAEHGADVADGIMILLADQPQVSAGVISTCAETFRLPARPPGILIATYRGRRGHPAIFRMDVLKEVRDWGADRRLNELAAEHPAEVRELAITTAPMPLDVNTPEDYERMRNSR